MTPGSLDSIQIENILVVRKHNHLGDMLCSLPLFAALKKRWTASHITLVVSPVHFGTNLKEVNPYADEIIEYDKSSTGSIIRFYKRLRKRKYQLGIVPSTVKISRTSHIINYFSGAKYRAGVKRIDGEKNPFNFLLNIKSEFYWDSNKVQQTERNMDIARLIGCDITQAEIDSIRIHFSHEDAEYAAKLILQYDSRKDKKLIAVHPGGGKTENRWNENNFVELIVKLEEKFQPRLLITSGSADKDITAFVLKELDKRKIKYIEYNQMSIPRFAAVLEKADLLITNDTGPMHISAWMGTATLAVFGPTKGYEWAPRGEKNRYIQSETGNVNNISVESVFKACCELLEK
jgi:heptosyltransferase-1